jgi:hypothetical protein
MALLARKKQIITKVESTKGTEATGMASEDAVVAADEINFEYAPEEVVRNPLRSSLSPLESIPGPAIATVTCRTEIKGSGTGQTPPSWGAMLRACGFTETVNTSTVVYALDSDDADTDTISIWVYNDGIVDKVIGARGTVSFDLNANQLPYMNFTFSGIYSDRATVAMATEDFESTIPDKWYAASLAFTGGIAIAGANLCVSSLSLDMNNDIAVKQCVNAASGLTYAILTGRDAGGTINPDRVLVATEDWTSHINTPTTGALAWNVGSGAGETVAFSCPYTQIISIADGDEEGVSKDDLTFKIRGSSGDDEITITHQ